MKTVVKRNNPGEIEAATSAWIARRDAGLTAELQTEFDAWMAADPRHARALARHEQAWGLFDRARTVGQAGLMENKLRALAVKRRRRRATALAGGLLGLIVAGLFWREGSKAIFPVKAPPSATNAVVVLPEKRTLPDGSIVELKTGADIAVDFSGPLRRISLRKGEAHFQVAKNPARPFVVESGGIEVRAVGTAFAVQLGSRQLEVVVTEGRIAVDRTAGAAGLPPGPEAAEPTLAAAGNRVLVDLGTPGAVRPVVRAISDAELSERLDWLSPHLELSGVPLGEAVQLMNRYNRVRLVIDPTDADLARLQVSGYFRANNVDTFLRLIGPTLEVTTDRVGDTITLRKAR
jgi:transmembrane sensor